MTRLAALVLAGFAMPAIAADIAITLDPPDNSGAYIVQYGECKDVDGEPVGISEVWGTRVFPASVSEAILEGVEPVRTCILVRWHFANGEVSLPELAVVSP